MNRRTFLRLLSWTPLGALVPLVPRGAPTFKVPCTPLPESGTALQELYDTEMNYGWHNPRGRQEVVQGIIDSMPQDPEFFGDTVFKSLREPQAYLNRMKG